MSSAFDNFEVPTEDLVADLNLENGVLFRCSEDGEDAAFVLTAEEMAYHTMNGKIDIIGAMAEISKLRGESFIILKEAFDVAHNPPLRIPSPSLTFLNGIQQHRM